MPFIKYPKIHQLGTDETNGIFNDNIVVQSKVDGANFSFWLDDTALMFGSRNKSLEGYTEDTANRWIGMKPVLEVYRETPELFKTTLHYYGESLQKHTLSYDTIPPFVGYDVFSLETGEFLDWKTAKKEFELLDLEFINIHFEKPGKDVTIEELKECIKNSPYRKDGDEGIVIKNYIRKNVFDRPLFGKIVEDGFKEKNAQAFTGHKRVEDDSLLIVEEYCTPARIEKAIHKLVDEGERLDMALMSTLFRYVNRDIFQECGAEIYSKYTRVDFKLLNKLTATRCLPVLKRVLEERI